jgi:hypothetical protein
MMRTDYPESPAAAPRQPARLSVLALVALATAILPALVGVLLLVTVWLKPPLIDGLLNRFALGRQTWTFDRAPRQLGVLWGIGLLVIGGIQAAGVIWFGLSVTTLSGFVLRTVVALLGEALLAVGTLRIWGRPS